MDDCKQVIKPLPSSARARCTKASVILPSCSGTSFAFEKQILKPGYQDIRIAGSWVVETRRFQAAQGQLRALNLCRAPAELLAARRAHLALLLGGVFVARALHRPAEHPLELAQVPEQPGAGEVHHRDVAVQVACESKI